MRNFKDTGAVRIISTYKTPPASDTVMKLASCSVSGSENSTTPNIWGHGRGEAQADRQGSLSPVQVKEYHDVPRATPTPTHPHPHPHPHPEPHAHHDGVAQGGKSNLQTRATSHVGQDLLVQTLRAHMLS
jgi:hypothetical protein